MADEIVACSSCGAALERDDRFCGECGTPRSEPSHAGSPRPASPAVSPPAEVDPGPAAAPPAPRATAPPREPPPADPVPSGPRSRAGWLVAGAAVLAALVLLVAGVLFLGRGGDGSGSTAGSETPPAPGLVPAPPASSVPPPAAAVAPPVPVARSGAAVPPPPSCDDPAPDGGGALALSSVSRQVGWYQDGRPQFEWTAVVEGPPETLQRIAFVRYCLHETFKPHDVVDVLPGYGPGFPLVQRGWGGFDLRAIVVFDDGSAVTMTHRLRLR